MIPQASTTSSLNPFAPEYHPVKSGVTPSPRAPPPSYFPPPQPHARHPPPPLPPHPQPPFRLPHEIIRYPPYTPHITQRRFYPTCSTYYSLPQNQARTTPPPQRPPPRRSHLGRGFERRGRGRNSFNGSERKISNNNDNFASCRDITRERRNCVGSATNEKFSKRSLQKTDDRHKIMPLNRDEDQTTVMIKNIPYDCPRKELVSMLDSFCLLENHKASNEAATREDEEQLKPYAYDFLYLPFDFGTGKSRGFAFVNFTTSKAVWKFFDTFHLKTWDYIERLKWPKKLEVVSARIQGKEDQVKHFLETIFECGADEYLPVCFSPARDGSGQPVELTVVGNRRPAARWEPRCNH